MKRKANSIVSLILVMLMLLTLLPMTALAVDEAPTFSGTIVKSIVSPGKITFTDEDFTDKYEKNDGSALESIVITGSDPSFGTLKFDNSDYVFGNTVTVSDLHESKLTFSSTGAGTVSFTVKAYAEGDTNALIGSVTLTINTYAEGTAETVNYKTDKNTLLKFDSEDFTDAFPEGAGTLSYIKFTLPSSSEGKLFYNYRSATDYDSLVFADTEYSKDKLSKIAFVPAKDYTGTVTINYKAYNSADAAFSGKVVIAVSVADADTDTITYTGEKDASVTFASSDFEKVCENMTGKPLSEVKFTLPSATVGKLYYNYRSATDYDAQVAADTLYQTDSSPYLSKISFVPAAGYTGDVTINYKGYNTSDEEYTGKITVKIGQTDEEGDDDEDEGDFEDVGKDLSWAKEAIEYLFKKGVLKGEKPGYFNPHASVKRGDFILMLCRAFNLKADRSGNFTDVDEGSYYYEAISMAKSLKIVKGAGGKFNPKSALSREDAMVLIFRALDAAGIKLPTGSSSGTNLNSFTDKDEISDYAVESVNIFVKVNIVKGNGKKINPRSSISRAEISVILYRILTNDDSEA